MEKQLHKMFDTKEVVEIFEKYLCGEIIQEQAQTLLRIGRSRFFVLLKKYRGNPDKFSIEYGREKPTRILDQKIEGKIMKALRQEKSLIEDKKNPIRDYNYSFIKETLERKHGVEVSLTTIINRAKKMPFIMESKERSGMIGKF